ncbi:prolyl 3-hydroxylase sudestada1-like isoform X2 [Teleopsis dalmanni]|uniref:prolyl 3-hydroxylase sudestada1-like isoform X2 n=2 Tax=Teleopsis dalmanni TaxID=139649 RepID=UPI0018CEABAE|nr:prolyl 3-hydroxylase sudestada1-like isoform X2 [Teleopsis dalmanni]
MDEVKRKSVTKEYDDADIEEDTPASDTSEPSNKKPKVHITTNNDLDLSLNPHYATKDFTNMLTTVWNSNQENDYKHDKSDAEVYFKPFQICLMPKLLQDKNSCRKLVDEMVHKVHWSRKQMDLYEFYQSTDLSNMSECKYLTNFLYMLRRNVRPWLEKVTNLKLDYVSASCSMYTCGDFLLVHDDLLKDRQIAFIYYLSPWTNAEEWTEEQGGCLEIFNSDESFFPQFPVNRKISPKNNQFAFFKVGSRSFHQVGEVTNFDYPRLTINGWFHGTSNDELIANSLRPLNDIIFKVPEDVQVNVAEIVNEVYITPDTCAKIQERIETNSEICLYEFFKQEIFEAALKQLKTDDSLIWQRQGPANARYYEILQLSSASSTLDDIIKLFSSKEMFALLRKYTDLDLAGDNAKTPMFNFEIQRWTHGNYTVLGDNAICEENTLDLIYYLNAADGAGVITYLAPDAEEIDEAMHNNEYDSDDESVLLTLTPVDNSLNIVYRCLGTTKFTKYVSRNTPLNKGPVFVISCSYKE